MFETIVERLLNKILGQYVEGFSSENLKIGLWSGDAQLNNVEIKKEAIKKLNLPFKIKYSMLKCLKMNIPWKSLATSKIQVVIEGFEILIAEIHPSMWQCKNQKIIKQRKEQIKGYCESIINDFAKKAEIKNAAGEDKGYFSNLVVKIIDNLQVTIKDIHIRYEDEITKEYSFGATLEELKVFTVNDSDEPIFIDRTNKQYVNEPLRKKLILSNFGIYWNEKSNFFSEDKYAEQLSETIARKNQSQGNNPMNYIILMSIDARLLQRQKGQTFSEPEIDFYLNFDQLKIQISNKQLQQIVNMGQRLQKYTNQVKSKNRVKISKEETEKNIRMFTDLFPLFYKNPDNMNPSENARLEAIIEKMEIDIFKPTMKKYLYGKERERIIQEKKDKSRGWFTGPKELSQAEKKEIQNFLDDNFGKDVPDITRPKDFYYIRINLNLKVLEIVIANSQNNKKEGIRTKITGIATKFKMRQNGYLIDFTIMDIDIDLFKKIKGHQEESKQFLKKMSSIKSEADKDKLETHEYVRLIVEGSPLDRLYADTYIKLVTQELLIMFDPRVINIAINFANIKVNAENSSAALEKYGEIKQKTSKEVSKTLESTKKSLIYIDIKLKSITAILYLNPAKPIDCWAVNLGETRIYTDKQTLKQTEVKPGQPSEKYTLELNKISFRYFKNQRSFLEQRKSDQLQQKAVGRLQDVLTDLNIDVSLEMYPEASTKNPKIHVLTEMSSFKANLTSFTYKNLQKVGDCFVDKETDQLKVQQRSEQKSEVMKGAMKIGFLYIQENLVTKSWRKYIGVLTDTYLYLYKDKKDVNYSSYYYIRNSILTVVDKPDPAGKPYCFNLKNKVNAGKFGFDKRNMMEEWIDNLNKCKDDAADILGELLDLNLSQSESQRETEEQKKKEEKSQLELAAKEVNPNTMNFVLGMKIEEIAIITYLTQSQQPDTVKLNFTNLKLKVFIYERKMVVQLSLLAIDLSDNIKHYKNPNLGKFLYTERESDKEKLIDIKVEQYAEKHPDYCHVDSEIFVSFGKLICNYKAETVSAVMLFFIPPADPNAEKRVEAKKEDNKHDDVQSSKLSLISTILAQKIERFSLKVHLNVAQISVRLINSKNQIFFAELSMQGFEMLFGISDLRMVLTGGLQQFALKDYSNYPKTIIQEQSEYKIFKYIMTSERKKKQIEDNENQIAHLIFFDINMLNKANDAGKKMIIITEINDLEVSYVQQPVLRLITYLTTQMLPSLSPQSPENQNKNKKKNEKQEPQEKPKALPPVDTQPEQGTMDLCVTLTNINVIIEPRNNLNEELKLNMREIKVVNQSVYRDFIEQSSDQVLVENYHIQLTDMSIFVAYTNQKKKQRVSYKLTPDIDFKLSVDLIANPLFYQKTYGKKFQDGMRIEFLMSDFFMRINHDDYNFMMKCLNWNVTYDDNAELYLYDAIEQTEEEKSREIPPLYLKLRIESISLFVIEEELPLAFMLLNSMDIGFTKKGVNSMIIQLGIEDLIGSSLVHKDQGVSIEKGMFNSFAYQRKFQTDELRDLDQLLEKFQRKDQIKSSIAEKKSKVISFHMETDENQSTFMGVKIEQLKIAVEMKTLLVLSQLALMEDYIQPPKSQIEPLMSEEEREKKRKKEAELKQNKKPSTGKTQIYFQLKDFLASLSDTEKQSFFVMDGEILGKMLNLPVHSDEEVVRLSRMSQQEKFLEHSKSSFQLSNFSIYFCDIKDMKNKRFILKPFSIFVEMNKYYEKVKPQQLTEEESQSDQEPDKEKQGNMKKSRKKMFKEVTSSSEKDKSSSHMISDSHESPSSRMLSSNSSKQDAIVLFTNATGEIDKLIFEASIRDLLKINEIVQDNLANLNQEGKGKEDEKAKKLKEGKEAQEKEKKQAMEVKIQAEEKEREKAREKEREKEEEIVERTRTEIKKPILYKTKAKVKLNPMSILVINDCDQNFMPVIRFILQESIPTFESDIVKSHVSLVLTFGLSFFNPRSSKWEPVIENYGAGIDYLSLIGEKRNLTKIIVHNSEVEELKELKINVSTQFIASLMSTLEKSKEQQKMLKEQQINDQIEVSPFIFENITNKNILVKRKIQTKESEFVIKPMWKGSVRLTDDAEDLFFMIGERKCKISLQHYGVIRISGTPYYIEFKVNKLNRVIRFLSETIIQSELTHNIHIRRYFRDGSIDEEPVEMAKKHMLALDNVKEIQVSINKRSFSEKANISLIKSMDQSTAIKAQNGKFLLWLTNKSLPNHFTVLQIWSPLNIYNCLPKEFTVQFIVSGKVHTKEIEAQQSHEVNANLDFYQLKIKINVPGFYWSPQFQMKEENIGKDLGLELRDRQNGITTINYIFNRTKRGYSLIIYCKTFLVSELQDDILAYGNLAKDQIKKKMERYFVLGGQRAKSKDHDDDIVIIGSEYGSKLRLCGEGCMVDFSQPFSLGGIGMTQNRRIAIKRNCNGKQIDLFTTIGVDVSIKQMFKNLQIFSKMVNIHSRSIIINSTNKKFDLKEDGSSGSIFSIDKGQKKNLFFTMPENAKKHKGMIFSTEKSSPSFPINISELGTMYFKLQNYQQNRAEYYKIVIQEASKYIFYEIKELTDDEIPYQVQNLMPKTKVYLRNCNIQLMEGEKFSFINETNKVSTQEETHEHKFNILISHENSYHQKEIEIFPDNLNFKHREAFDIDLGGMRGTVHTEIKIKFNDSRKFIIIDQVSHGIGVKEDTESPIEQEKTKEYEISSINLKLEKITFSLIQNHISIERPFESFCFFLNDLQFINQETNKESRYQIKLRYLQFDQDEPFNMPNPVIITPYRMKEFFREKNPKFIFNTFISISKEFKTSTFINKIQLEFNDLVVKVSQYFIDVVMQMTKEFTQVINYKEEDYLVKRQIDKWNLIEPPKEGSKTFIKHIRIAPFVLEISAEIKLDKLDTQSFLFFGTILNVLGVVITNIQGAPINLDGIELKDCVDTLPGINAKLVNHYKNTVIKQLYKIFGSLNIIGNPIGLFRNISTGIKDLKDKPSEGFVHGPLEFGKGIAEGTGSLIAHSVGGALNSVSKVTGTISTGLAVLTFDKEFEELREKQKMQKPQHIFQGLEKGGKAVFYGFREGIKGVFMQPYENTKKEGVIGFFKEQPKDWLGLVVKPVTGVIDFASKTTEGLKNTALYLQDKPNENRMRYPRVFYTECCTVKDYDEIDSKLNAIINKMRYEGEYDDSFFIESFICDDKRYLLVMQQQLMMIRLEEEKISWCIKINNLSFQNKDEDKELHINDGAKHRFRVLCFFKIFYFQKSDHVIRMENDDARRKITSEIDILHKEYN